MLVWLNSHTHTRTHTHTHVHAHGKKRYLYGAYVVQNRVRWRNNADQSSVAYWQA